jgi:hypothetical protein
MRFNTLHEMVQHVESLPFNSKGRDATDWSDGSQEDAVKLATWGWPEGARLASEKATRIADRLVAATGSSVYQAIEYDVVGAAYDAGAVALGIPEAWGVMAPQPAKRAVRIVLNCTVSGGVPASAITARGLAVCALALALQARGYPVTVDVFQALATGSGEDITRVSDAVTGSQLDLDRVVYALAHPTMFRRLFRAVTNGFRNNSIGWTRWDGSPVSDNAQPNDGEKVDLFLGGAHLHHVQRWQDGGEAWVIQEYLRQTGA